MLWLVAGLATTAFAQQSSSSASYDGDCDGSNDPPSCMSSLMASTSSSLGPRQSGKFIRQYIAIAAFSDPP